MCVALGLVAFAAITLLDVTVLAGEAAPAGSAPTHQPGGPAPAGMVWIPRGQFMMGTTDPTTEVCGGPDRMDDARPIHAVFVDGFWMDETEVTNEAFAAFVSATHYVTIAEKLPRAEDYPNAAPELLVPGSVVFTPPKEPVSLDDPLQWWSYVPGANWRHPEGPASSISGREKEPVVHVAYADAAAFAQWAKKALPTEAQWEFAARGGKSGERYSWGNSLQPHGQWMANIWQGEFPTKNTADDGFLRTSPVASFPANGYGLYDMAGNVWEWCSDWYRPDTYARQVAEAGDQVIRNPHGPAEDESIDPQEPGVAKRVQRGGSFLCTDQYCTRYMVGSRGKGAVDTGSNHLGFRCVRTVSSNDSAR